jgi:Fungalysin metallopeptidase (M36)
MQLVFDAMLLMSVDASLLQARDAALAADLMRFGGANQKELWLAYSRSGMGRNARVFNQLTFTFSDFDPMPDFESPLHDNATIRFVAKAKDGSTVPARIFVGHYEARVSPIADTDPSTPAAGTPASVVNLDDTAKFAPATYEFVATAPWYGHLRFSKTLRRGEASTIEIRFPTNHASTSKGAVATGDTSGADAAAQAAQLRNLSDDTENTSWTTAGNVDASNNLSVDGKKVTVDLAGTDPVNVRHVNVSALLGPGQSRFTALRRFELWACNEARGDCTTDAGFDHVYTGRADAFPGDQPRPIAPVLILREFDIPNTRATHLRLVVETNQCTGGSQFQGDQDADPVNNSDCDSNTAANLRFVRPPSCRRSAPREASTASATRSSSAQYALERAGARRPSHRTGLTSLDRALKIPLLRLHVRAEMCASTQGGERECDSRFSGVLPLWRPLSALSHYPPRRLESRGSTITTRVSRTTTLGQERSHRPICSVQPFVGCTRASRGTASGRRRRCPSAASSWPRA